MKIYEINLRECDKKKRYLDGNGCVYRVGMGTLINMEFKEVK